MCDSTFYMTMRFIFYELISFFKFWCICWFKKKNKTNKLSYRHMHRHVGVPIITTSLSLSFVCNGQRIRKRKKNNCLNKTSSKIAENDPNEYLMSLALVLKSNIGTQQYLDLICIDLLTSYSIVGWSNLNQIKLQQSAYLY